MAEVSSSSSSSDKIRMRICLYIYCTHSHSAAICQRVHTSDLFFLLPWAGYFWSSDTYMYIYFCTHTASTLAMTCGCSTHKRAPKMWVQGCSIFQHSLNTGKPRSSTRYAAALLWYCQHKNLAQPQSGTQTISIPSAYSSDTSFLTYMYISLSPATLCCRYFNLNPFLPVAPVFNQF